MLAYSNATTGSSRRANAILSRSPLLLPFALVLVIVGALIIFNRDPIGPDVSGQLLFAREMRHGARLYTDIVEINPPLWFWLALPVSALADALHLRPEALVYAATGALILASLSVSSLLLGRSDGQARTFFLVYLAAILALMPLRHFEQREHLALIVAVPYVLLAAARRRGAPIPAALKVGIGAAAALGFAFKPLFLLVPLLLEGWLLAALRRQWRPLRPETIAAAAVLVAYAAAVAWITPEYLSHVVPELMPVYLSVRPIAATKLPTLLIMWGVMVAGLLLRAATLRAAGGAPLTTACFIAGLGFAVACAAQDKGWLYQGIPAMGFFGLALAASIVEKGYPSSLVRLVMPMLLCLPFVLTLIDTKIALSPNNDIAPAVRDISPGDRLGLITTNSFTEWPVTTERQLRPATRYVQYWVLLALHQHPEDPRILAAARTAVRETAQDYACTRPAKIIFLRVDREEDSSPAVDPYPFFMGDPAFAEVMRSYTLSRRYGFFDVFTRTGPQTPPGTGCRRSQLPAH